MIFSVTLFGIFEDINVEIDYKGDVLIDVASFEIPDISGFEFSIPANSVYLPLSFNSDEINVEILTTKIERDTTEIVVDTATGLAIDEYFWLGNELIYIENIIDTTLTIQRAKLGTIANRYKRVDEAGIKLYLTRYPVWLIGKLLKIESTNAGIIQYAVLDKEPTFENGLLTFSCSDLTKTLENDLPQMYFKNKIPDTFIFSSMIYNLMGAVDNIYGSYDYVPEIFSFLDVFPLFFSNDILTRDSVIDFTKIGTYKELVELCLKLGKSILYLDKTTGRYELKSLSPTLSFQANTEIKMLDYMKSDVSYKIQKQENIKRIVVTYTDKKGNNKKLTFNITNVLSGKELQIDLTAFTNINYSSIFSMIQRYFYDTGFVYAVVEFESTELVLTTLKIGEIYKFNDVLMYSFQDVTSYCMFLGSDGSTFKFAILKNYEKTLISPAVPVKYKSSYEVEFGWLSSEFSDFELQDFLNISGTSILPTLQNASFTLNDVEINYFEVGDKINLYDFENDFNFFATITDITGNVVTLDDNFNTNDYWLLYDVYSNANTRQKKFFYLNINKY